MKISSIFSAFDAAYNVIAGDFNCRQGSRFNDVFHKFLHDEQLTCVDMLRLNGIFTYLCDDGQRMSWIDHIVCSPTLILVFSRINYARITCLCMPLFNN